MHHMNLQKHSAFLLQQKLTLLINRYEYFLYERGTKGERIAFAEQARFAFREAVTVWTDDSKSDVLFTIKAEKLLDVHGKFLVHAVDGTRIGYCQKAFGASLLRSTWEVYDTSDTLLFTAKEKSQMVAVLRRIAHFIPFVDEIAQFIPFNFLFEKQGAIVGGHTRIWGSLTDQYKQEIGSELTNVDRRLVLALGILLDALQAR